MTEKRFTGHDVFNGVNEYFQFYNNNKRISNEEILDLLNTLHEENQQLKQELKNGICPLCGARVSECGGLK